MKRRGFVKLCASAVAGITASPELLAKDNQQYHRYDRVALVDPHLREAINVGSLEVGETYLFHYPFISTPCFLINLGRPVEANGQLKTRDGQHYRWQGGAGPEHSIVAFSAICAHKMSHPAPTVSFINYRHGEVKFRNSDDDVEARSGVIYCCSERSVYDPANGGRVLGGPAPQPLAAIELEYDAGTDHIFATGTIGGEMFERYFSSFRDRLVLQLGRTDIDHALTESSDLMKLSDYTRNQVSCEA
jgi:arsenite oxidase small subunit